MVSQGVKEDPPPLITQQSKSWVSVAKEEKVLKKYEMDISDREGKQSVIVPSEIVEKANLLWDDFVIARFLDAAPHVAKVHVILNKIWAFGNKDQRLDVYEMDATTMRIRIPNAVIREKVIRRGMWNIAGIPMVASKWSPIEDEDNKSIPLWVYLKNVPMSMYSWEGLSFIASPVGIPDHLHAETIACSNFEIAKVCVKADLTKPLPKKIDYNINEKTVTVEYLYPWLPSRCEKCGKWGHLEAKCGRKEMNGEVDQKKKSPEKNGEGEKEKSTKKKDQKEGSVVANQEESSKNKEDIEEGQIREEWVTPGKSGRNSGNQKNLQYGEVRIATPSRFSALSMLEEDENEKIEEVSVKEKEVEKEEDKVTEREEVEINEEDEEDKEEKQDDFHIPRQSLPRGSKDRHKVLSGAQITKAAGPSKTSKKGTRKNKY